jgi:general stress protein CsbA
MKANKAFPPVQLAAFGASLFSVLSGGTYILYLIFLRDNAYQAYEFMFVIITFWVLAAVCGFVYLALIAFDYFRKEKGKSN